MGSRDSYTQISSIFRPSGKVKPSGHRLGIRALPGPSPQFQPVSCPHNPAPGGKVEFGLTHKVNFSYTFSAKSDFLSNQIITKVHLPHS
jgi:hypothetical protein